MLTIPPGFHLPPQRPCPACGAMMLQVDDVEGLPIYQCPECMNIALTHATPEPPPKTQEIDRGLR